MRDGWQTSSPYPSPFDPVLPPQHPLPLIACCTRGELGYERPLEEIITSAAAAAGDVALVVGDGREDGELGVEVAAADRHDGGDVAAAVAVVGGGPDGDDGFLGEVELWRRGKVGGVS